MAKELKTLVKDTAIYGISSIVGRFLNYLLVPLHTTKIIAESGGYGVVSNVYAYTALLMAILTFGMETTFFRFSNKEGEDSHKVYGTTLWLVGGTSALFCILCLLFNAPISALMGYSDHPEYIACMTTIVSLDALQSILFARLRGQHRPVKFMALKMLFIILSVLLNLFIFLGAPAIYTAHPEWISWWYNPEYSVGYIFFINLICTIIVTFGFIPELRGFTYGFDRKLAIRMLKYALPILVLSIAGILNQVADKITYRFIVPGAEGDIQLGIYGACTKIAMIMALLTQAFRYAYEPFVFGKSRDKDNREMYATTMKYFIIFTLLAFLAVVFYMDILKYLIGSTYWEGLRVVPIVMMAEIFMGIYFNLSFWYKLRDKTYWGAIMSVIACAVLLSINFIFVPRYGYVACAWGGLAGYGTAMLLSYFIGQHYYPIRYDIKGISVYFALALVMFAISQILPINNAWARMSVNTIMFVFFIAYIIKHDLPLNQIPIIKRFVK